jgi:hypothetical protein
VRFLRLGGAPLAIIAVGFSVAAAHWNVGLIANLRNANACAGNVGAGALAWLRLAPQTGGAWDIGDTAASLTDTGGAGGADEPNQRDTCQSQARGDRIWQHGRANLLQKKARRLDERRAQDLAREDYAITIAAGNDS